MKPRKGAAVLCAACLIGTGASVLPAPAAVHAAEEAPLVYEGLKYETAEGAVTITGFTEDLPDEVTVPAEIDGLPVTKIGTRAFRFNFTVTRIVLPDSVTEIGSEAFKECTKLKSVVLPEKLKSLPESMFLECTELESVNIPAGVEHIGDMAFRKCYKLAELEIPTTAAYLGEEAFTGTEWLEIKRGENPFVVINHILIDGKACTGDIVLPSDITAVGASAFSYNHYITSVVVPENVKEIRRYGFYDCTGLQSITILNPECEIYDLKGTISNFYARHEAFMMAPIRGLADSTAQAYAEKYEYPFEAFEPAELRGDFNGDCTVGLADAQSILNAYVRSLAGSEDTVTEAQKQSCDINGDGAVDVADAQLILLYYVKNTVAKTPTTWEQILNPKTK